MRERPCTVHLIAFMETCVIAALAAFPPAVAAAGSILLLSTTLHAQVVTGSVLDAADRSPIRGATVSQVTEEGLISSSETNAAGRFQLSLRGTPPYEIVVARMSFGSRVLLLDSNADYDVPLEILISADPLVLPGVEVEVDNAAERFNFGHAWEVTNSGMNHIRPDLFPGCYYLTMNGVVIRDSRLFMPALAARYEPAATLLNQGWTAQVLLPRYVSDRQVRRDAWPCGIWIVNGAGGEYRGRRRNQVTGEIQFHRNLPEPDAPLFSLGPGSELARVERYGLIAQSPAGEIVIAGRGATAQLHNSDGTLLREIDFAVAGFSGLTDAGWVGDTLWVADASRSRIAILLPGADTPLGRAYDRTTANAPPGPAELTGIELPRLVAGGRWLASQAVPDASYPRRPTDPPTSRHLFALDSTWTRKTLLTVLRPAPDPLVPGLPDVIQPLRDHTLRAVSPDGEHITIVRRTLDTAMFWSVYSVERLDLQGNTIFHVERTAPLVRVTDEGFDAVFDELAEHPWLVREFPSSATRRALVRGGLYRPATYYAPISNVVVGRDGTTWLRWPDNYSGTVRWDVLDSAGQPIRVLNLDRRLEIINADGDAVWGMLPDDAGMQVLTRFTLQPN
jgi:hypothetical protein